MSMENEGFIRATCFILGGFLVALMIVNTGTIKTYHNAKEECEKTLARDKSCIMEFKPEP